MSPSRSGTEGYFGTGAGAIARRATGAAPDGQALESAVLSLRNAA